VTAFAPIRDYLDALVHPSVRADALIAVRHRAFMAPRLFASLAALGTLPVFLVLRGTPSVLEFIVLAWIIVPIAMAYLELPALKPGGGPALEPGAGAALEPGAGPALEHAVELAVDVRGDAVPAEMTDLPFYRRSK